MFKDLLKAKRRYYGETGWYPTAIKITTFTWNELKMEGKAISLNAASGLTSHSINGLEVYFDDEQKERFIFGFHYDDKFSKEAF